MVSTPTRVTHQTGFLRPLALRLSKGHLSIKMGPLTLYIQKDSPGKNKESNGLPAFNGQDPIYMAMRLYWLKEAALKGMWQPPAVQKVN